MRQVRKRHGGVKGGHAGTLDPLASGLLVCLLGSATKLARYLVGLDKRYVAEIELGRRTTTGDAEGDELEVTPLPADLDAAIAALVGEVELPVPVASAVKIGGERAYRLHRRGVAVEMPLRASTVHALTVTSYEPPLLRLELHVGSGTYVRALADALGGSCRSIRRTAVGPFRVEDADETLLRPSLDALPFLPVVELDDVGLGRVLSGQAVPAAGEGRAALAYRGSLVAVAKVTGGTARPETVIGYAP